MDVTDGAFEPWAAAAPETEPEGVPDATASPGRGPAPEPGPGPDALAEAEACDAVMAQRFSRCVDATAIA